MKSRSTGKDCILDITPAQCRAARGLLHWEARDLGRAAGVHWITIHRFENDLRKTHLVTKIKILAALEAAGVEFKRGGWLRLKQTLAFVLSPIDDAGDVEH